MAEEAKWYVVHTYSGYENKVKADIEKTIENRNLQDQILEVLIPLQTVVEEKNGEKKQVQKKMFPAYVLINMIMNDQTWYVVRNTRGVTGFVGPGSKPVPLTEEEIANMGFLAEAEAFPLEIMLSLQREYGRILTVLFRKFTRQNRWQLLSLICLAVILRLRLTSQN